VVFGDHGVLSVDLALTPLEVLCVRRMSEPFTVR
jgi:hypothetical protein